MSKITKIKSIKNLGIWRDYRWNKYLNRENLTNFDQYNIIYGLNASGKTTLSKLFNIIVSDEQLEYKSLEYSIEDQAGNIHTHKENTFSTPIRVFNADWISSNIDFVRLKSTSINAVLGEKNVKALANINKDTLVLRKKTDELAQKNNELNNAINEKDKIFTNIAKQISQATHGVAARNYNKRNAKNAFKNLQAKSKIKEDDARQISLALAQPCMDEIEIIDISSTKSKFKIVVNKSIRLLSKTVDAIVIERLKDNPDISIWVENGLSLHEKYKNSTCEFCGQPLCSDRLHELMSYFNDEDKELKNNIDEVVKDLKDVYNELFNIKPIDKMNLYPEIRKEYKTAISNFTKDQQSLLIFLKEFIYKVENKKLHTTEKSDIPASPLLTDLLSDINAINIVINNHNNKTSNYNIQRKRDVQKLEKYYLSTIYDEVHKLNREITNHNADIEKLQSEIEDLKNSIQSNKSMISSTHKACEKLNQMLKSFLGHSEITFKEIENDKDKITDENEEEDKEGYEILRNNVPATNLSEGEKTAIAFTFFIAQLKDGFDIKQGIVVIDDPISSLDANSRFLAFSFLKNGMKDVMQLFVFTHNFEFLKLLLNWLNHPANRQHTSLYMIKNKVENNIRQEAYLDKLDKSLEMYETEYQYLFKMIYNYKSDDTIETAYTIPNIARKLLDSFLLFQIPNSKNIYRKLEEIDFDEVKKTAIYKFVNDQSHITGTGFDPSLVPEAQKIAKYLIDLIKYVNPKHYEYLEKSIKEQK